MKKKMTLKTRPFQPFLLAANDLLALAEPYFEQIEQDRRRYEQTGKIRILPQGVWQKEKSLSIASFMMKYAGLEALTNCAFEDFKIRDVANLPDDFFIGHLGKIKKSLQTKDFGTWYLPNRVFFLVPLCSDPIVDPRRTYDISTKGWELFEETVQIRHSFSHAVSISTELVVTKAAPKLWTADDQHPNNFWPLTGAPRDHRILNYETALALNQVIDWVLEKLRRALPEQLSDSYMTQEQAKVAEP